MNTKQYPLNPRDENQPILPRGNKALFITLGIFFLLIASTVVLLNYATAPDVQYSNLESDAFFTSEDEMSFPAGTMSEEEQSIPEKISALERKVSSAEETGISPLPVVDFGN